MSEAMVEIDVEIIKETDGAFAVSDGYTKCFVPKNMIEDTSECELGANVTIEIPEWFAIDKGLV